MILNLLALIALSWSTAISSHRVAESEISVAAAVSLKDVITEAARAFEKSTENPSAAKVRCNFGASGELATQIQHGGAVDLFISASQSQIDDLTKSGMLGDDSSRTVIARNALVLIVPTDAKNPPASFEDLADATKAQKLAIGRPDSVPAGEYAMQTLTSLKLADVVKSRLVYGANVRQVLAYVEAGEVSAGIVYRTDAMQSGDKVKVVAVADEKSHRPIEYPAVIIKGAQHADNARAFLKFLQSDQVKAIFKSKGFVTE